MPLAAVALWRRWITQATHQGRIVDEAGASVVEYALILLLVVLVAFVALQFVGNVTANTLNNSGSSLFSP